MAADYARLTEHLACRRELIVTLSWAELDAIVGGLPASASEHHPQWWHGDRPNTRAWRRAGFELDRVDVHRSVTFRRTGAPLARPASSSLPPRASSGTLSTDTAHPGSASAALSGVNPPTALLVVTCSARKRSDGWPGTVDPSPWPQLAAPRAALRGKAIIDESLLMPAWQRYRGHFYTVAGDAVRAAAQNGRMLIISGGYGLVKADEPIGMYDKVFKCSDWPTGLLERLLVDEVANTAAEAVVAFSGVSTDYGKLIGRALWPQGRGVPVVHVTGAVNGGGAMVKVPIALGRAFAAFWNGDLAAIPSTVTATRLA